MTDDDDNEEFGPDNDWAEITTPGMFGTKKAWEEFLESLYLKKRTSQIKDLIEYSKGKIESIEREAREEEEAAQKQQAQKADSDGEDK